MTDKNIIKALECCINDDCDNCPDTFGNCEHNAMRNALNLINRQQEEIERLKIENQSLRGAANSYKLHYNEAKTEAVKEFADRLKALDRLDVDVSYGYGREHYTEAIAVNLIDNLIKEMAGDTE